MRCLYLFSGEHKETVTVTFEHTGNTCFVLTVRECDAHELVNFARELLSKMYECDVYAQKCPNGGTFVVKT